MISSTSIHEEFKFRYSYPKAVPSLHTCGSLKYSEATIHDTHHISRGKAFQIILSATAPRYAITSVIFICPCFHKVQILAGILVTG